jgi:hypothetical protein
MRGQKEIIMLDRFTGPTITVAIAATAIGVTVSVSITGTLAQAPAASVTVQVPALKTPWGEPDLQGIWTDEFDTPLQRPAKYAEQEFFTDAQRTELDKERTEMLNRRAVGTLADAYNFAVFLSTKRTGTRTSKIVESAQWSDSAADGGGTKSGRRGSGVSSRPAANDRYVQEDGAGLRWREI